MKDGGKQPNWQGVIFGLISNIIWAVFFGIYAFNNPDKSTCWAQEGSKTPSPVALNQMVNVTESMTNFFTFAFIVMCASMAYSVFGAIAIAAKSTGLGSCAQLIGLLSCTGGIAIVIWGSIIRWGEPGRTCAGDFYEGEGKPEPYLWKTGKFMKIYLILLYIIWGLISCCCLCMCIGNCCAMYR